MLILISLVSFISLFSFFVDQQVYVSPAVCDHAFAGHLAGASRLIYPAVIADSQPTQRGHGPLMGAGEGAAAPFEPSSGGKA